MACGSGLGARVARVQAACPSRVRFAHSGIPVLLVQASRVFGAAAVRARRTRSEGAWGGGEKSQGFVDQSQAPHDRASQAAQRRGRVLQRQCRQQQRCQGRVVTTRQSSAMLIIVHVLSNPYRKLWTWPSYLCGLPCFLRKRNLRRLCVSDELRTRGLVTSVNQGFRAQIEQTRKGFGLFLSP